MSHTIFKRSLKNNIHGFTLVELLVSISLFMLVILIAVGTLLNLSRANDKSQAVLVALNNLDFALENMTRTIRTGTTYHGGGQTISFTDSHVPPNQVTYYREEDLLTGHGSVRRSINGGPGIALTAEEIDIRKLSFYVGNESSSDNKQPRVLMLISGRTTVTGLKDDEQAQFNLQTTVSQRIPDL